MRGMKERLEIAFIYLGKMLNKQLKGRLERRLSGMLLLSLILWCFQINVCLCQINPQITKQDWTLNRETIVLLFFFFFG